MRSYVVAAALVLALTASVPSSGQDLQATSREAPAPSMTVLGSWQAESILGKEVRSKAGESMGHLIDIVVDRTGRPRAAVIDFGGFFGVGSRKIAIDWNAINFESDGLGEAVTVDLTRDQAKGAPEYKDRRAVIVLGSAGSLTPAD